MENILNSLLDSGLINDYLHADDLKYLKVVIKNIQKNYLYSSHFHGLYHSEKVLLFALVIAKSLDLNELEKEILIDAAIYHDCGRSDDNEDTIHGYSSAIKIGKIVGKKEIYQKTSNLNILKCLCDSHSLSDNKFDQIVKDYEIEDVTSFRKLYNILKDADALDRTRFRKTASSALKTAFLRLSYSKDLVEFAYKVNEYYRDFISEYHMDLFKKEALKSEKHFEVYHGIGFNFFALISILEHGILSGYAKKKKGVFSGRNFYGNNNDLWISVSLGNGESKEKFIDTGISFKASISYLKNGETKKSIALSEGLPIDSELYTDEAFAFYEIPVEALQEIIIPKELLNKNIKDLTYLNGSNNYDSIVNNIDFYLHSLRVKFKYFPDITKIENLKKSYLEIVEFFEEKDLFYQKQNYKTFFSKCDQIVSSINIELASIINNCLKLYFNKDELTLLEIIESILNSRNILYSYENGVFKFKSKIKIKDL